MSAAQQQIVIMAGGTGGHVYPAIAVAENLRSRGYGVMWLGTVKGIEARVVPEKGFPIQFITAVGVRGKGLLNVLKAPFLMLKGLVESVQVIWRVQPVVVLGMGGFVSVPGGIASWLLRKPLVIHEQNAVAGTANRWLSRIAAQVLEGFPDTFAEAQTTGNPVRQEITHLQRKVITMELDHPINLLVLGGSLGAKPINDILPAVLKDLRGLNVWHQTGKATYDATLMLYAQAGLKPDEQHLKINPYIEDMAAAYGWADLVLCRAGAITLAEIACAGLPAILVPLPHAIDNHQQKNAEYFVNEGAAVLMPQSTMTCDALVFLLTSLITDRARLSRMAKEAKHVALPGAARAVADVCVEAGSGGQHG